MFLALEKTNHYKTKVKNKTSTTKIQVQDRNQTRKIRYNPIKDVSKERNLETIIIMIQH